MSDPKKRFIEKLFAEHGGALQRYIYRRIRTKSDAPDLAQEVYVRMLRVSDTEAIRNPQLYLYTVASNLVKEHAVRQLRLTTSPELDEASVAERLGELPRWTASSRVLRRSNASARCSSNFRPGGAPRSFSSTATA